MPDVQTNPFNVVCGILGTYVFCFSFVSYLLKDRLYISEALISVLVGVIVSSHTTNISNPYSYVADDPSQPGASHRLETTTYDFARLALSVQVFLAGTQLPKKYVRSEWRALFVMLGPGMLGMWLMSSLLIWAIIQVPDANEYFIHMSFLQALVVGACITPTDPVLSNTIVKGRWADLHVPVPMAQFIIAESGANDGLGYPFLFLALYLFKYLGTQGYQGEPADGGAAGTWGGARSAMGQWFGETWGYLIALSVVWGVVVGWISRKVLRITVSLGYVAQENLFAFPVVTAVFIVGTCGLVGSDDILACFVAGNTISWDGWLPEQTRKDSFEPTVDMLLNSSFFVWFGAVCPWPLFGSSIVSVWRLIVLGIVILLLRRPLVIFILQKFVRQVKGTRQALFVGFFGPIGVSAIFYQHVTLEFLRMQFKEPNGELRGDAQTLHEVVLVVVWFVVLCSVIVHGITIPIYQCGVYLAQHISPRLVARKEKYSIRHTISREKKYIESQPWALSLEAGLERRLERARPMPPFRRVRTEKHGV